MKLNIKNWKTMNKTPRILVTMKSITEDEYANQYANALSGDDSNNCPIILPRENFYRR